MKTENVRFRTAKPILTPIDPKMVKFRAKNIGYHFQDGHQPEMEPLFPTTSASQTGVWAWVSPHRGRHKRSNEPKTAAQQHSSTSRICPALLCPMPPRACLHEPMGWDSDGVDCESLASCLCPRSSGCGIHRAQPQLVSSRTRVVGVWEHQHRSTSIYVDGR